MLTWENYNSTTHTGYGLLDTKNVTSLQKNYQNCVGYVCFVLFCWGFFFGFLFVLIEF